MRYSFTTYNLFKLHLPFSRQNAGKLVSRNDFVAFQEWVSSLHIPEDTHVSTCTTFTIPFRKEDTGTATISSHPPLLTKHFYSLGRELGFITKKSMIMTHYKLGDTDLTIFNCHALNFVENKEWEETMKYWVEQIPDHGPVIFAGDLNTWHPARFEYLEKELKNKKLHYANYDYNPILRLDHIWYRDLNVISCTTDDNMHSSDHYPVTLHFTLK